MITMYGAMAQSESESISGNIRRGRQMHAKVGRSKFPATDFMDTEKTQMENSASYQNRPKWCAKSTSDMRAAPACET